MARGSAPSPSPAALDDDYLEIHAEDAEGMTRNGHGSVFKP